MPDLPIKFEETLPCQGRDLREVYFDLALQGTLCVHCNSEAEAQAFRFACYRAQRKRFAWKSIGISRRGKDLIFQKQGN